MESEKEDKIKTINYSDYLKLKGLEVLAKEAIKQLDQIEKAIYSITKEEDDCGHSTDFTYGARELDDMLTILKIEVQKDNE